MENYAMTNFEEMVADEMFPETSNTCYSENFPTKDRKHTSARRKKTYFKGKKRFDLIKNDIFQGFQTFPKTEQVTKGMLRKTNVIKLSKKNLFWGKYDHNTNKRLTTANDKLVEFAREA